MVACYMHDNSYDYILHDRVPNALFDELLFDGDTAIMSTTDTSATKYLQTLDHVAIQYGLKLH